MNVTTRQLQAFLAVARLASFTRAAEEIFVTQAGLSLMLKDLEAQVGTRLFDRTTRSVHLTPSGEALLPVVRNMLAEWQRATSNIGRISAEAEQEVTLAATPLIATSILPRWLEEFQKEHPGVRVHVSDLDRRQILQAVERHGGVDIVVPNAGIARVVYSIDDPNPAVAGNGAARLRAPRRGGAARGAVPAPARAHPHGRLRRDHLAARQADEDRHGGEADGDHGIGQARAEEGRQRDGQDHDAQADQNDREQYVLPALQHLGRALVAVQHPAAPGHVRRGRRPGQGVQQAQRRPGHAVLGRRARKPARAAA